MYDYQINNILLFQSLSMEWFVKTAQNYRLTGASVEELCEHNAEVAKSLDRQKVRIHEMFISIT